jgi:hypothetical protein
VKLVATEAAMETATVSDLEDIMYNPCFIVICGEKATGKSIVARDLIESRRSTCKVVLFCPLDEDNINREEVAQGSVYANEDTDSLYVIVEEHKQEFILARTSSLRLPTLLIVIENHERKNESRMLRYLAINSRHWQITVVCAVQCLKALSVSIRANIDFLILMRTVQPRGVWNLIGCDQGLSDFTDNLHLATRNYGCLIISICCRAHRRIQQYRSDCSSAATRIRERLMHYHEELIRISCHPSRLRQI